MSYVRLIGKQGQTIYAKQQRCVVSRCVACAAQCRGGLLEFCENVSVGISKGHFRCDTNRQRGTIGVNLNQLLRSRGIVEYALGIVRSSLLVRTAENILITVMLI